MPASLPSVATDELGRAVYVDLQTLAKGELFEALLARLLENQPTERALARLTPINRGRILVEIEDEATLAAFSAWLRAAVATESMVGSALRRFLEPLGPKLRLLGSQWIVPRVTEHDRRRIAPQTPHSDVDAKGEVVSIAIHVKGCDMGTLIDANARIADDGNVVGGRGFERASTPAFIYDTGVVHGGPGVANVAGPYPRYFVERVFFLLSSHALEPDRIKQHRKDNALRGAENVVSEL